MYPINKKSKIPPFIRTSHFKPRTDAVRDTYKTMAIPADNVELTTLVTGKLGVVITVEDVIVRLRGRGYSIIKRQND